MDAIIFLVVLMGLAYAFIAFTDWLGKHSQDAPQGQPFTEEDRSDDTFHPYG